MLPIAPRYSWVRLPATLALLILPRGWLRGQQPDLIPRELAVAHARLFAPDFVGGDPTILVGDIPASVRTEVPTPPDAEIVGSIIWGSTTQVIGKAKGDTASIAAWFWGSLETQGWKRHLPQAEWLTAGGFIEAPDPKAHPSVVCKNRESVEVRTIPLDRGRSYYQITLKTNSASCESRMYRGAVSWSSGIEHRLPVLYSPRDAEMNVQRCQVIATASSGSDITLTTGLSPTALLAAYGRQLDSAGWVETKAKPSGAAGTWTRKDSTEVPLRADLTILTVPSSPSCRLVHLNISRIPTP